MKKSKIAILGLGFAALTASVVWAADHIDAPAVAETTADITDYYAFQSPSDNSNMVFVANLQGLLSPTATASASFDEDVMVEFNIDNDGDFIEDLVIQVVFENGKAMAYGPFTPSETGTSSTLNTGAAKTEVDVTAYGETAKIGTSGGFSIFAGPRDDPFFMDFAQYGEIIAGNATSFNDPGNDTFAGTNVMSVVIELPKSDLGSAATLNTWVEAKREI